jgi:RNA polymerase sigma-70 factor (ECF subfamily)
MTRPGHPTWDWDAARAICLRETSRLLRDRHEAEDAAQEAVVRAWRARSSCHSADTSTQWLRAIAGNEARRIWERRSRLAARETGVEADEIGEERDVLDDRLGAIACDQMLAPLTPRDRELMRLRYMAGLSQAQIAESLRIPEGTVKIRLHRSRARLRTLLSNEALGGRH